MLQVLDKVLLKEEIYKAIENQVSEFVKYNKHNEETFESLANRLVGKERTIYFQTEIEEMITVAIYEEVQKLSIGQIVVDKLVEAFKEGKFGGLGPLSLFVNASMIESLGTKLIPVIDEMVANESESIIRKGVENKVEALTNATIGDVISKVEIYEELIKSILVKSYEYMVRKKLSQILDTINLAKVVEDRIQEYDPLELEKIILEIMNKELKAIIWLGALLGAIMGCIMNILPV